MAEEVSAALRGEITLRAGFRCEYCLMPQSELLAGCEVDHIISRKHSGRTEAVNLALSCERCNRAKGSEVGSLVGQERKLVRLFNPRTDSWRDHFALDNALIKPRTEIGEATGQLLRLNAPDRV